MLQAKIHELKQLILSEASLVVKMLSLAIEGLYDPDYSFSEAVMTFEKRVNSIEVEIDNKCVTLIALQQPEAKDLRQVLMIYRINNDLERLGDQAVNIAESSLVVTGKKSLGQVPELLEMKTAVNQMLRESLEAFTNEDEVLARKVCANDNIVDDFNRRIISNLIVLMKKDGPLIEEYLHLMRISRNLERIADLSTNIAESTIYLSRGKVINHGL